MTSPLFIWLAIKSLLVNPSNLPVESNFISPLLTLIDLSFPAEIWKNFNTIFCLLFETPLNFLSHEVTSHRLLYSHPLGQYFLIKFWSEFEEGFEKLDFSLTLNRGVKFVCCLLSVVCCLLSVVCCLLSVVCCLLSVVCS